MSFIKKHIILLLLCFLILGIVLAPLFSFPKYFQLCSLGILLVLLILSLFIKKWYYHSSLFLLLIALFFTFLGSWRFRSVLPDPVPSSVLDGSSFVCVIKQTPVERTTSIKCVAEVTAVQDSVGWVNYSVPVMLFFEQDSTLEFPACGDKVLINKPLSLVRESGNPYSFNYKQYLYRKGIQLQVYVRNGEWVTVSQAVSTFSLENSATKLRNVFLSLLNKSGLQGEDLAVASAILLGYDELLNDELRASYAAAGALHVLCVSGMHVGVIYLIAAFLLAPLKKRKHLKLLYAIFLLLTVWFYALLTGLSPSVTRAATMFSFVAFGDAIGRKSTLWNSLFCAAFVMLLYQPFYLYNIGFQLSFAAVIAIVGLQPPIKNLVKSRYKSINYLCGLIALSLAAQLGTGFIAIYYFHQFPTYFLVTNLFVVFLSSVVIYVGMLLFVVSFIPVLSLLVGKILHFTLFLLNGGVRLVESLPGSTVEGLYLSTFSLFVVLALILFGTLFWQQRRPVFLILSLCSGVMMLFSFLYTTLERKCTNEVVFYNLSSELLVDVVVGREAVVLYDSTAKSNSRSSSFATKEQRIVKGYQNRIVDRIPITGKERGYFLDSLLWVNPPFFQFADKRFVFYTTSSNNTKSCSPLPVDFLLFHTYTHDSLEQVLTFYAPQKIILLATLPYWTRNKIINSCENMNIPYFDCRQEGAFIYRPNGPFSLIQTIKE